MLGSWRISLNAVMQCQVKGKIEEKALWIMIMCSPLKQLKFCTLILKSLPEPTQQLYVLHIRSKEVTMLYNIINNITQSLLVASQVFHKIIQHKKTH